MLLAGATVALSACSSESPSISDRHQKIYETNSDGELAETIEWVTPATETYLDKVAAYVELPGGSCTGTFVGKSRVIIAAHCLLGAKEAAVTVSIGFNKLEPTPGTAFASEYVGTEEDHWSADDAAGVAGAHDVAVIQLDDEVSTLNDADFPAIHLGPPGLGLQEFTKTNTNSAANLTYSKTNDIFGYGDRCDQRDRPCPSGELFHAQVYTYVRLDPCGSKENNCNNVQVYASLEKYGVGVGLGDSGGPLFIDYDGATFLAGILSTYHRPDVGEWQFIHAPLAATFPQAQWMIEKLSGVGQPPSFDDIVPAEDFGLFAEEGVTINDRSLVSGAGLLIGAGAQLGLGVFAQVDATESYSPIISLREYADLNGRSEAYWIQEGIYSHTEDGFRQYPILPTLDSARQCLNSGLPDFTDAEPVALEPDVAPATFPLQPGVYGDVNIKRGRTLQLQGPGDFYFNSLNVDSQALLDVTGGARIYVKEGVILNGDFSTFSPDVLLMTESASGVFIDGEGYRMHLVAPNTEVILNSSRKFKGTIQAKNITLHQDSEFTYEAYNGVWCD